MIIIINGYVDQTGYEKLSQIAPTLAYDLDDWKASIIEIGKALNREEKANAVIQAYDDKLKQAPGNDLELKSDYLFVTAGYSGSLESNFQKELNNVKELEKLEVWKAIPAVKQNHDYKISARHWMLSGPISDSMKIDDVYKH